MRYLLLLFCLVASTTFATDYYVSLAGDDDAAGTSWGEAYRTIQHGVEALTPGDTLIIGPGEYREHVRRQGIGSMDATTTIRAQIPGTVLVRGDIPMAPPRKAPGYDRVFVTDVPGDVVIQSVLERDTLTMLGNMPNADELNFRPGTFYQDKAAGKLFFSTSDLRPADQHHYTLAIDDTHGLYFSEARRLLVEGITVTGFKASHEQPRHDYTLVSTWGIFITNGYDSVIRDCRSYLNGQGIGINSFAEESGGNVIERCTAWGNHSLFGVGDRGGLTLINGNRDAIRNSLSFRNGGYGLNIRGGSRDERLEKYRSVMERSIAWGNGLADIKIKTGYSSAHGTVRSIGYYASNAYNPIHCLVGEGRIMEAPGTIFLSEVEDLEPYREFADPDNHDYRLQSTSQFLGAAPDGEDMGPYPYQANVHFVSPSGNDDADGLSVDGAWKTLAHALAQLQPGDTLYLLPGSYTSTTTLAASGTADQPITIRSRGTDLATISGTLTITGGHIELEHLHLSGELELREAPHVSLHACLFSGGETSLKAMGSADLSVAHCTFTGFTRTAIALVDSRGAMLSGNLFDDTSGQALQLDDASTPRYVNYNSYSRQAADVAGSHHQVVPAQFAPNASGQPVLRNALAFATGSLTGRPFGIYRDQLPEKSLRLAELPKVHSLSATTANLEWMVDQPATCLIAWGTTPACENELVMEANSFGTYSLTGLEPGQTYYFTIKALNTPITGLLEAAKRDMGVNPIPVDIEPIRFTTPTQPHQPVTYHVANDGDNANDGRSRQTAWRTISHAAAQVLPGDTVLIAGGRYPERVRIRATGDEGAVINLKAAPGERVMMDGADLLLNHSFVVHGKSYLHLDGFYFDNYNMLPRSSWSATRSAEINLLMSSHITISRCFADGRGGYSPHFISTFFVDHLTVRNCVMLNKMSGAMLIWRAPNTLVEHNVFGRPLISSFSFNNTDEQPATFRHNVFTDMLAKKAKHNIAFAEVESLSALELENNSFLLREFPPAERHIFTLVDHTTHSVVRSVTMDEFNNEFGDTQTIFADPAFQSIATLKEAGVTFGDYEPDTLMNNRDAMDFSWWFVTNPELIERGIGLQPEAFQDMHFHQQD